MSDCKNTLKPKPIGSKTSASNVIWNGGVLCIGDTPLDGQNLITVLQQLSNAHCSLQEAFDALVIPPPVTLPTIEEEVITNVNGTLLDADPNFVASTYFQFDGLGYETLVYQNTSGSTKTYIVNALASIGTVALAPGYGYSDVDMAIFKRDTAPADTQVSEVLGNNSISYVGDGIGTPANEVINNVYISQHTINDIAEVTLQDQESVLLKFKTKGGASGFLNKAILHIREKHN